MIYFFENWIEQIQGYPYNNVKSHLHFTLFLSERGRGGVIISSQGNVHNLKSKKFMVKNIYCWTTNKSDYKLL